ncbi:MAG: hypothetical protein IT555_00135 [Acetobacteraceae bacterium]|nr:hypothetical protein [Acetobacteraceae bacterium]
MARGDEFGRGVGRGGEWGAGKGGMEVELIGYRYSVYLRIAQVVLSADAHGTSEIRVKLRG